MANIGAIQTKYAGHLFRSRLEARWAVFFDVLGIPWKYEHEGYEVGGHKYLPDFYLPKSNDWCEVKGDKDGFRNDFNKMSSILGPNSPLPGFVDGDSSLILLSDIPLVEGFATVFHPALFRPKGTGKTARGWSSFISTKNGESNIQMCLSDGNLIGLFLGLGFVKDVLSDCDSDGWDVSSVIAKTALRLPLVNSAYEKARSSRFEHGESGAI